MKLTTKQWVITIIIVVLVGAEFYFLWISQNARHTNLSSFAQCIAGSGAKFYGAFWCPHCQEQKAKFSTLFASAADKLPYIECSTPDINGQLQVCNDEKIKAYPTWKFTNGKVREDVLTLQELSDATGCQMPN